ncbi:UNVERIFIED_CONTAM: hypothetical protein K2H54_062965 [Gekko kuhli]
MREEEMPDVEIDIDDLLDAADEEERALKLQEALVDCYKPTEGWWWKKETYFTQAVPIPGNIPGAEERLIGFTLLLPKGNCNEEDFIKELLSRIRGMRKLSPPQKKSI